MHGFAGPPQHGSAHRQAAQSHTIRRAPTSTGQSRMRRRCKAWCKGCKRAASRIGSGASAPSDRHAETPACTRLQADLPAAQLRALRPARRDWSLLERIEKRMGPRPSEWPMRSRRSPTAAWVACGRRTVEVSQACRHVSGAATAEPLCTCRPSRRFRLHLRFDLCMEMGCLHAQPERRLVTPSVERGKVHTPEAPFQGHRQNFDW